MSKIFGKFPQGSWFLLLIVSVFSVLRLPSVIEPRWYGDEGIYQVIGIALNSGRTLYSGIWDNKPPLLYYIYALFAGDQFTIRLLSLVFGALSVIVFYFLAEKLFKNKFAIYLSTGFFAIVFGLPIIEGNIANAENFMLLPILAAFYFVLNATPKNKNKMYIISGILLSLAFLTKIVALFDLAALVVYILTVKFADTGIDVKKLINGIKEESFLIVAFIIPILLTTLYFVLVGAFPDFFRAAFSQNIGYVGHGNNFLIPMGFLYLKFVILIVALLAIFIFRKSLGKNGLFIIIWLAFSCFNSFFSARPYTHYLLVLLPAFSLFLGYVIEKKKLLIVTIPLLIAVVFFVDRNFSFYKKITPYYKNYFAFLAGGETETYRNFFDKNTPRDYKLADFIKSVTNPKDGIFLWSDSAQIYVLSGKLPPGRYAVAYHVTFYPEGIGETKKVIDSASPKYIIQTKEGHGIENFLDNYELRYKIEDSNIYERKP